MDNKNTIGIDFIERLSGGNHELFHSNLLAFLAEHEQEFFRKLFNCNEYDKLHIGREDNNLDLCLYEKDSGKMVLVIENKMKSRPSKAQLKKYVEKNKHNFADGCKLILLTLLKPTWEFNQEDTKWTVITYNDLIGKLRCYLTFNSFTSKDYLDNFIKDYIDYVGEVDSMVSGVKEYIERQNPTFDEAEKFIKNDRFAWAKSFAKKAFSLACLDYLSEICDSTNLIFDIIENNRGIFGIEVLIPVFSKSVFKNNEDETEEGTVMFFINLQGRVLCRGFRIYTQQSKEYKEQKRAILKRELTKRGKFLIKIWNEVLTSKVGSEISEALLKYGIDLKSYGKGTNVHSYIFDDFAMPYLAAEKLPGNTPLKIILNQMKEEIITVKNICEEYNKNKI